MFLTEKLIYKYNDMAVILVDGLSLRENTNFLPQIPFEFSSWKVEIIENVIRFVFFKAFNPILAANLLLIFYLAVLFSTSYLLFRKFFTQNRIVSFIGALFYSANIYVVYRAVSLTTNLYQIFIFPIIVYLLEFKKAKPIYLGTLVFILFNFSAYYAYFSFLLIVFWYFSEMLLAKRNVKGKLKNLVTKITKLVLPIVVLLIFTNTQLLLNILPIFEPYNNRKSELKEFNKGVSYRPIEDFYNFSFRPWYFVIPPKNSFFFEDFSETVYRKIQDTNYYLANDYSEEEAAGSYMGWHFVAGAIFVLFLVFGKGFLKKGFVEKFPTVYKNEYIIKRVFIIIFLILLFSHPPSFTIRGITFYTPTYVLYYILPIFRTMVRWSVVIYLFVLLINLFLFCDLLQKVSTKYIKIFFAGTLVVLNYYLVAVKVPVVDINEPPPEVEFLKSVDPNTFSYAVYPKGDFYSMFWILYHKKKLINPADFVNTKSDFSAQKFTEDLVTTQGCNKLRELNGKYLVYYKTKGANSNQMPQEQATEFFDTHLKKVFVSDTNDVVIYFVD
jgi:hypothetical protein